ncbi:MAG: LacI family DNA-binding transcriptional regulator [Nocardia sp.]|nr:LacI family DNA-binding transcriptional regulator [Nocardia sp.]
MGHANPRPGYFEARYRIGPGQFLTLKDPATGRAVRFKIAAEAKRAADRAEVEYDLRKQHSITGTGTMAPASQVRNSPTAGDPGDESFFEYADRWYQRQDLAASTMHNYRSYLECHLLPYFGTTALNRIDADTVARWLQRERGAGHGRSSINQWRGLLHTILEDACTVDKLITTNHASKKRGRGRRTARAASRRPAGALITGLQALLIAERMALLSGRDDEFVWQITKRYTGMRSGEVHGLETRYLIDTGHPTRRRLRVEWQLAEVRSTLIRCPPKDESRRDIDLPMFLWHLLSDHVARTQPQRCDCHDHTYVFRGNTRRRAVGNPKGVNLATVAARAGVSVRKAQQVFHGADTIDHDTRERVWAIAIDLGYSPRQPGQVAPHWSRSSFREWIYAPAASGKFPRNTGRPERPVPIKGTPFPGLPIKHPHADKHADACWMPLVDDIRPHRNRHSLRTDLEEVGIPKVLIDERIGHIDSSVQANYTHVTDTMRDRLCAHLTDMWTTSLDARLTLSPTSPVAVLNDLLRTRAHDPGIRAA